MPLWISFLTYLHILFVIGALETFDNDNSVELRWCEQLQHYTAIHNQTYSVHYSLIQRCGRALIFTAILTAYRSYSISLGLMRIKLTFSAFKSNLEIKSRPTDIKNSRLSGSANSSCIINTNKNWSHSFKNKAKPLPTCHLRVNGHFPRKPGLAGSLPVVVLH